MERKIGLLKQKHTVQVFNHYLFNVKCQYMPCTKLITVTKVVRSKPLAK